MILDVCRIVQSALKKFTIATYPWSHSKLSQDPGLVLLMEVYSYVQLPAIPAQLNWSVSHICTKYLEKGLSQGYSNTSTIYFKIEKEIFFKNFHYLM